MLKRVLLFLVASLTALASCALVDGATQTNSAELVSVRRIWDAAPHNAFTDLARFQGRWLCVFREGSAHVPGSNGTIRVLQSRDGEVWQSAALVAERGIDLRDPKISIMPDGRAMLLMGGSFYAGEDGRTTRQRTSFRTRVAFSTDGSRWSPPKPVSVPEGNWLWRVTWHGAMGYGFSYRRDDRTKMFSLTLWRTKDGLAYEKLVEPVSPPGSSLSEATIRFLPDNTMIALARGEQTNRHAFIGRSAPPYKDWQWADARHPAQGPNFLPLPDGRMFYAGRDFPDGSKTVMGRMTRDECRPLLTLPSGGDTSYPGICWQDGVLWISYYSSHEGKAGIYLAKCRLLHGD